jgi:hybrid cluster-associated redox disulfide protein
MQASPYVVTKYIIAAVVVEESPRAAELLAEYGLSCMGCFFSENDTLEAGAKIHGMSTEEIDDMVTEINSQLEYEWKKEQKTQ